MQCPRCLGNAWLVDFDALRALPDNTYTPYGIRSVRNLASVLGILETEPTVVTVINKAHDEITFLRILASGIEARSDEPLQASPPERQEPVPEATPDTCATPRNIGEARNEALEEAANALNKPVLMWQKELKLRGPNPIDSPVSYARFVWQEAIRTLKSSTPVGEGDHE
jgi:hypothetical protein